MAEPDLLTVEHDLTVCLFRWTTFLDDPAERRALARQIADCHQRLADHYRRLAAGEPVPAEPHGSLEAKGESR